MTRTLITCLLCLCLLPLFSQDSGIPFTVELDEVTYEDWPGLHSFSFAEWDDYWVFVGGRRNGLHGFFAVTGFPESEANDELWVMDKQTGLYWSYPVSGFPDEWRDFLRGTNPQYVQLGQYLYIIGGYGKDNVSGDFVTFDEMLAIDLSILVPAVIAGNSPITAFRSMRDERFKVCGGEMHELGEYLYLVGGHDFNGLYNQLGNPTYTQEYTSEIRKFKIVDDGDLLSIENYTAMANPEFHRRDLSLTNAVFEDGSLGLAAFGGVFKPDADAAYLNPIYITEDHIEIDASYDQKMGQYTCPVLPFFDETNQIQYYLFFGGISLHYWDEAAEALAEDPLMPFIDEITAFVRYPGGSSEEFVLSAKFDELLGSNAKFIPVSETTSYGNGVVKYDELSGRTLLGYIYGGIRAAIPNITPSSASNRLFEVYVTTPVATDDLVKGDDWVNVFPNPSNGKLSIQTSPDFVPNNACLVDVTGGVVAQFFQKGAVLLDAIESAWSALPNGIYFLKLADDRQVISHRLVKGK